MENQGYRVSVIILTWNHLEYTEKAVTSLIPILKPNDEVIFVDNLSTDGTQEYLRGVELPCDKILLSPLERSGIGVCYNIGFQNARGEYIFIYDNDLEIVMSNTLDHMIEVFTNNSKAGIVCPCCNNIIGSLRSFKSANKLPNDVVEITIGRKKWWPECPSAAWLISRYCLDKVGVWDEYFDPYGIGDYDYGRRVILAGFSILCDRFVFVHHYGCITSSNYVDSKLLDEARNKFYKKWAADVHVPKGMIPPAPKQ